MERVLAVDLGGTKTSVGIVSSDGRVLAKRTSPSPRGKPGAIVALVARLAAEVTSCAGPAEALGIALPGAVDRTRGVLLRSPSSGLVDVPFVSMFEQALGLPARADNDANACAWAEARFGAGAGLDSFFWMTVSTGIGGAAVIGGRLVGGASSMAGEIGHTLVNPGGEPCGCGQRGCLEAEAAGPAWPRRALAHSVSEGGRPPAPRGPAFDARAVAEAARAGDAACMAAVRGASAMLSRGVAAVCNILDPECFIFGGGVGVGAFDLILPVLNEELPALVFSFAERRMAIRPSALGYEAGLIGAAALALYPY